MRVIIILIFSLILICKSYGQQVPLPCLYIVEKEDYKQYKIDHEKYGPNEHILSLKYLNTQRKKIDTVKRSYLWATDRVSTKDTISHKYNINNKRKIESVSAETFCECMRIDKFSTGGRRLFVLIIKTNNGYYRYNGYGEIVEE